MPDGTFRNPENSRKEILILNGHIKFLMRRKKLVINFPESHVLSEKTVLRDLLNNKDNDYITWIGHATFLIKLGDTTIITDPLFSKNTGPLIFGLKDMFQLH